MADRYWERGGRRWEDDERRSPYDARYRDEARYREEPRARGGERYGDRRDERTFFDRAGDEVRSWFGDEEAQRRRIADEREDWRPERGRGADWRGDWGRPRMDVDDRQWSRQWGYVDSRERDYGRGSGVSGYGAWGRDRGDWSSSGWGGQGAGGFGNPSNERPWSWDYGSSRDLGDMGRWTGGGQPRSSTAGGPHVGRGPRGYQRSDERIKEDVCERLAHHGEIDATDMEVRVQNGEVTLQGTVNERWAKRLAEDVAESVWGVKEVSNQLRVNAGVQDVREGPERLGQQQQRNPWAA